MLLPTSPNDPVFFLHHSNVDRLWAEWQDAHGVDSFEPDSCDQGLLEFGCRANARMDRMHPPFEATPADVADISVLGYSYDTLGEESGISNRARPMAQAAAGSLFQCEVRQPAR